MASVKETLSTLSETASAERCFLAQESTLPWVACPRTAVGVQRPLLSAHHTQLQRATQLRRAACGQTCAIVQPPLAPTPRQQGSLTNNLRSKPSQQLLPKNLIRNRGAALLWGHIRGNTKAPNSPNGQFALVGIKNATFAWNPTENKTF